MDQCRTIHETVIRDILDVIHDVKDSDGLDGILNRNKSIKSIANASKNLTLVFPCIVSSSLSIESASMIVKAQERKAVNMLQLLFAASNITDAKDGLEYLKNFHTNMKIDNHITVDSLIDALDSYVLNNESMSYEAKEKYRQISEDVKLNLNYFLPDPVSEHSLNIFKISKDSNGNTAIYEDFNMRDLLDDDTIDQLKNFKDSLGGSSGSGGKGRSSNGRSSGSGGKGGSGNGRSTTHQNIDKSKTTNNTFLQFGDNFNYKGGGGGRFGGNGDMSARDVAAYRKDEVEIFQKQLVPSDVKKANELVPTTMVISFISTSNGEAIPTQMLIGVKAKMYPVDSMDIINRVSLKYKDNNNLIKFIRSSTREISFFRDFLFAIDKAKIDALSNSKRGSSSPLWKILERRSKKSKIRRVLGQANDASAITTLVMSQEEVEYLKKNDSMNLEDPKVARSIMESYNFMSIVIVDESMEVAKFIYDTGDDVYESLAFSSLEREASDSSTKKIVNLMTKMSR